MAGFFDFARNEPCPCGSGKKYKKCCKNRLEKLRQNWRGDQWRLVDPAFARALAVVCGLPAKKGEVVPEVKEINEALSYIEDKLVKYFRNGDENSQSDFFEEILKEFMRLLKEDKNFRTCRFTLTQTGEFMDWLGRELDNVDGELDKETFEEIFEEQMMDWLAKEVDGKEEEIFAWNIVDGLRKRDYKLKERASLLFALKFLVEKVKPTENPFWELVLRVSTSDAYEAFSDLDKFREKLFLGEERKKGENDILEDTTQEDSIQEDGAQKDDTQEDITQAKDLEEFLDKYPMVKRNFEDQFYLTVAPVLGALLKGELEFTFPAYVVLGGLLKYINYIAVKCQQQESLSKTDTELKIDTKVLEETIKDPESIFANDELLQMTFESAWDTDFEVFVDAARRFLDQWLANREEKESEEMCQAVKLLKEAIGSPVLDGSIKLNVLVYVLGIGSVLERKEDSLLEGDDKEGPGIRWMELFTPEGLETYAGYLEAKANTAAAEHVRRVKDLTFGKASERQKSDSEEQ